MPAVLALAAAALFGGADFLGGLTTRKSSVWPVTFTAHCAGAVLVVLVYAIVGGEWSQAALWWGAVGGLAGTGGLLLLLQAMTTGKFQLVSPISAVTGTIFPILVGLLQGNDPGLWGAIGLLITPLAVWLLTAGGATKDAIDLRPIIQAVGAGLGFGVFFVCLAQTPDGAGAVPLIAARFASLPLLAVLARALTGSLIPHKQLPGAIGSGALDMAANGLFLMASRNGQLAVIGALVALYPASNAALARFVLNERLRGAQRLGFLVTIGVAVLLSI